MTSINLPKIGLGTWMLKPKQAEFSVIQGVKAGYRFIDTAQAYGNESGVGRGLQYIFETTEIKRDELIIATKIHPISLRPKSAYRTTLKSLQKLKLNYVDILYIHWPAFRLGYSHKKTLPVLDRLVDEGKIKAIGISNFTPKMVEEAMKNVKNPIFANQVEMHPYLQQKGLIDHHKDKNVKVIAYSPLGRGNVFQDPILKQIARNKGVSIAQTCLAWAISKGVFPIPKATSDEHIRDNINAINLNLSSEEIQKIDAISITKRFIKPPFVSPKEW